ncbi:MAG TPA: hypothetical protein VH083_24890 [Myxococcales bacterium]|nr:hypothetical protein [Myxococcales bacterium]
MLALLLLLVAAPVEDVIAHGGDLAGPPATSINKEGDEIAAYGFSEVPGDSRLQAAFALSDANARAELVKYGRVRIKDSLKSVSTESSEKIETRTQELAHGLVPHVALPEHGWRKLKRGNEVVLQVWSRITLPQIRFDELLHGVIIK